MALNVDGSGVRRRHVTPMLAVAAAGLVVGGCGVATPAAPSAAQTAERLAPRELVARASNALAHMHSLQVVATAKSRGYPRFRVTLAVQRPGRLSMSLIHGRSSLNIRLVGNRAYVQGSQQILSSLASTARVATLLAGRWIGQPASTNPGAVAMEKWTRGRTFTRCFSLGKHGALSYHGTRLVDGISTVVVRDRGNRPGTTPSLIYISATAPYLPLRIVQTGPSRPGGGSDAGCRLSAPGLQAAEAAGAGVVARFHTSGARTTENFSG